MNTIYENFYSEEHSRVVDNSLQEWCEERMPHEIRTGSDNNRSCKALSDGLEDETLSELLDEEVNNLSEDQLNQEISHNRRTLNNLRKYISEKADPATKKNYIILLKKENDIIYEIYIVIALLVVAICFGIYCIYNFFSYK